MYSSDLLVPGHLGLTETISPTLAAYIAHFLFLLALAIVSRLSASCEVELNALVSFDMCWCMVVSEVNPFRHFFSPIQTFFWGAWEWEGNHSKSFNFNFMKSKAFNF